VNLFWVTILSDSLDTALSLLCKAKPPFRICDKFAVQELNGLCSAVCGERGSKGRKAETSGSAALHLGDICERLKGRGEVLLVVGSKAVGIATRYGDGYRAILTTERGLLFLTYVPSKEAVIVGENCSMIAKVAGGECPRLKYEVWCRWCNAPDGRRYRRCWADVATNSDSIKRGLSQLKLHDIDEKELDNVIKALSSICS